MLSFLHDGATRIYILHEIITKLKILVFLNLYFPTFKFSFLKAKYLCSFRKYFFSNLPTILSKLLTQFMTNMSMLHFSWELNKQLPPPTCLLISELFFQSPMFIWTPFLLIIPNIFLLSWIEIGDLNKNIPISKFQ